MATTTNYGWTTPDDTALVKDGAAAIRTLGSSVDTTTKNLNPETTLGDISFRSSTSNVNTRLGIGTTGQVLNVSGGVPAWTTLSSGGMTLISSTAVSTNSVTVSSIPGTFVSLFGVLTDLVTSATTGIELRLNGDTGSNYIQNRRENGGSTFNNYYAANNSHFEYLISTVSTSTTQQLKGFATFSVNNYLGTSGVFVNSQGTGSNGTDGSSIIMLGQYNNAADITSVTVKCESTTTFTSGNFYLYGVK
jgi:hypothetical protein